MKLSGLIDEPTRSIGTNQLQPLKQLQTSLRAATSTVTMFVSKQVIEKLEGEQTRLRRDVKYLRHAAERGDNTAVRAHAEDLASRLEHHASLVDAVIEAVSEDSVA